MVRLRELLIMGILFLGYNIAVADTVTLSNGQIIEGRIIHVDKERQRIKLDVVINNSLLGASWIYMFPK